jgi:class 3 adenylate cyclase
MTTAAGRAWTATIWVLVGLWAATLASSARQLVLGVQLPGVYARAGDPYPTMIGVRPYVSLGDSALRPGDTLVEVDGESLAGAGSIGFFRRAVTPGAVDGVPVVYERDGVRGQTRLPTLSMRLFWGTMLVSAVLGLTALPLLLRARRTPAIRWGLPAMLMLAIQLGGHTSAAAPGALVLFPVWLLAVAVEGPLLISAVTWFPDVEGRDLAWVRRWIWLGVVRVPFALSAAFGLGLPPVSVGIPVLVVTAAVEIGAVVAILVRNYLRSDAIGRRQLRWTVLGAQVASLPVLLLAPIVAHDPARIPWMFDALSAFAIVPVCLVISVLRYNWFDVDRLLSATASYNLLGFVFVALGLLVAPRAGAAASDALGVAAGTGQTLAAVALAGALLPAYRRLQPRIERVFFPERHAVDEGASDVLTALDGVTQPGQVSEILGDGLARLFRAESVGVYAPGPEGWNVVFARGRAVPPALDAGGGLLSLLAERGRPLGFEDRRDVPLSGVDLAVLETLGARVVVPVREGSALVLLACLGEKGSGDVYTRTDLRLLDAVAHKASGVLQRFDQERRFQESRALGERLRSFVPGAVAEQLASGRDIGARECEVSVLFVDIRGYTAWAEGRGAADVFSTLNRYTEAVSEIVTRHGGCVVEFNGDGMMAVFGAPEPIPDKERSALEAARQLCAVVPSLAPEDALSVGVGVATGPAYAGAIRAVDRLIWSAVGNTTNLAARLQSLTRELGAAVVVDGPTWSAAGTAAEGLERLEDVSVRGRRKRMTLYALPGGPPSPRGERPAAGAR